MRRPVEVKDVIRTRDSRLLRFVDGSLTEIHVIGNLRIGKNCLISPDIEIGMPDKPMENFFIGDGCRLYAGQYASRDFICGDYVTIHEGVWAYGRNDIKIGHNGWFGKRCTLDAEGGFRVGNGIGAGQDTHLWSHIRHGDTLQGNRFLSFGKFIAGDDVWFVGRCTSGPAEHGDRSMALTESNITKSMPPDTIWGGNPAKDLTEKLGVPFTTRSSAEKKIDFGNRVLEFLRRNPDVNDALLANVVDTFDVNERTYTKTHSDLEYRFMRFLLPEAKFTPRD